MGSYKNYQSKNFKHKEKSNRVNIYEADFNSSVDAMGVVERRGFEANLDKWVVFVAWMRWFP